MASIYPNRKDGKIVSFKFKAFLGRDQNGKQIFKCTTWIPEKAMATTKLLQQAEKEATVWERKMQEEFEKQKKAFEPSEITFENFVRNVWLPVQLKCKDLRPTTITFQNSMLKNILPHFANCKLKSITNLEVERFLDYLKNIYRTKQNKPLAPKTLRHHYATLNLIFDYAMKMGYIVSNPLSKVDSPKLTSHKVDALSKGEVTTLIHEIERLPLKIQLLYTLLVTTGMRRGECFGLQWQDINLTNHLIHINRNITYSSQNGISVGLPKTDTGVRDIPLTNKVISLLHAYFQQEQKTKHLIDLHIYFTAQIISTNRKTQPTSPNT